MTLVIDGLKQEIRRLKEEIQRKQRMIRHIWDDIGGLQSDTKEQHRRYQTQAAFREGIRVREGYVEREENEILRLESMIREIERKIIQEKKESNEREQMGKEDKKGAGRRRKKGGKINAENNEITKFLLKHDLPSDIKKMRKLLTEAFEEIFIGDNATARQDVKQVGAILEQYNVLLAPNTTENYIPADILQRYEEILDLLRPRPPSLLRRSSPNNSVGDIQFNDADWEFLGAGLSRERETTNGNLRLIGGMEVSDDEGSQMSEMSEDSVADEFPFQFEDVLDVLEELQEMNDDDERRERWDEMGVDVMMTDSNTHLEQEPHLILTPEQEAFVAQVQQLYQFWRNHLFPPLQPPAVPQVEGGKMKKRAKLSGGMLNINQMWDRFGRIESFIEILEEEQDDLTDEEMKQSWMDNLDVFDGEDGPAENIDTQFKNAEIASHHFDFSPEDRALINNYKQLYFRWKYRLFPNYHHPSTFPYNNEP